jgi:hypothetical protein
MVITKSGLILSSEGSAECVEPVLIEGVENDFD